MNCRGVEEQEILERYLLGRLTDPEREEFEQHFFECDSCFAQVQSGLAIQEELGRHPPVRVRAGGVSFRQLWAWTPAFAAIVLLAAGIWWYSAHKVEPAQQAGSSVPAKSPQVSAQRQQPAPAASLGELAKVEAPSYSAVVLRGAEDESQERFRKAMQHYVKNDYAGAIPGLRAAVKANPGMPGFHFYLGACYLLTDQTGPAIESLRKTISLNNPAYSEPAHFYLAKAYLRKKDLPAAENELQATVQLAGSKATEAQEILHQLGK